MTLEDRRIRREQLLETFPKLSPLPEPEGVVESTGHALLKAIRWGVRKLGD